MGMSVHVLGNSCEKNGEKWQNPYDFEIWFDKKNFFVEEECHFFCFAKKKANPGFLGVTNINV